MKLPKFTEREVGAYGKLKEFEIDGKKVSFWQKSWPNYDELKEGAEAEFSIKTTEKNGYTNHAAYPVKSSPAGNYAPRSGAISKAMEPNAHNIEKAQSNQEWSIILASTKSMAVDISLAECQNQPWDSGVFKAKVKAWRSWLVAE